MERFQLLNADIPVLSFSHDRTLIGDTYSNIIVHEPDKLPIRMKSGCTDTTLRDWIERRAIPVNRHHMEAVLGALNLEKQFHLSKKDVLNFFFHFFK